jgi:hypothetical protein
MVLRNDALGECCSGQKRIHRGAKEARKNPFCKMERWLDFRACRRGKKMALVTAEEIFGLAQGTRVRLKRTMADMIFQFVASGAPEAALAMKAIDEQAATVVTADDNEVAIRLDERVSLPSDGGNPAAIYDDITVTLKRGGDGLFEFSIAGKAEGEEAQPLSLSYAGLSAEPASKGFRLVAEEPRLRITPAAEGVAQIEAYTAPFMEEVPAMMRAFAPNMVGLISLTVVE